VRSLRFEEDPAEMMIIIEIEAKAVIHEVFRIVEVVMSF